MRGEVSRRTATSAAVDKLEGKELVMLAMANYRSSAAAGWQGDDLKIVATTHIMAVIYGALEVKGEWTLCTDLNVTNVSVEEGEFLDSFDNLSSRGGLVCAMAAVNHHLINHTTGQSRLQGFA